MKCPVCGETLSERVEAGITVDVCDKGCGGIWFDNLELKKVDEAHESAGEALLGSEPRKPIPVDRAAKRLCPRCPNQILRRHYFSVRQEVEVDDCPRCGGIWLDACELAAIRKQFTTEQERKQAADAYISKLFDKVLAEQAARDQATSEFSKKFAHALRFICPSYWIPGKQSWGAF